MPQSHKCPPPPLPNEAIAPGFATGGAIDVRAFVVRGKGDMGSGPPKDSRAPMIRDGCTHIRIRVRTDGLHDRQLWLPTAPSLGGKPFHAKAPVAIFLSLSKPRAK